jgi:hypothetical protein
MLPKDTRVLNQPSWWHQLLHVYAISWYLKKKVTGLSQRKSILMGSPSHNQNKKTQASKPPLYQPWLSKIGSPQPLYRSSWIIWCCSWKGETHWWLKTTPLLVQDTHCQETIAVVEAGATPCNCHCDPLLIDICNLALIDSFWQGWSEFGNPFITTI